MRTRTGSNVVYARSTGFTLVEILITILLIAVLVSIAIPQYRNFVTNSRYSSAALEIVTAMNYGRSEAIRRQRTIAVAAVGNNWQNGWEAFVDADRNGVRDVDPAKEPLLRRGNAVATAEIEITNDAGGSPVNAVMFDSAGGRSGTNPALSPTNSDAAFMFFKTGQDTSLRRVVCVKSTGRVGSKRGVASCVGT